jgi:hypothetical protein
MKKLKYLVITALVATSVFVTSCKEDEVVEPNPTATMTSPSGGAADANTGDTVNFTFTGSANVDLTKLTITVSYDGAAAIAYNTFAAGTSNDSVLVKNTTSFSLTGGLPTRSLAGTEVYTFSVTDKNGNVGSAKLTLTVTDAVPVDTIGDPIDTYSTKLMGGQTHSSVGSFFATTTGTVYLYAGANSNQALIDFVYFYGTTNEATMAAPNDADANTAHGDKFDSWTTKNATKFKTTTVTTAEFDAIAGDQAILAETTGAADTKLNMLATGNVGAFVTEGGKHGLFKVVSIAGTSGADREITIDVKVQQ